MSTESKATHVNEPGHGNLVSYVIGFILSLILTLAAYFIVEEHLLTGVAQVSTIVGLCVIQVLVQLLFFLHVGSEPKPRWNYHMLLFTLLIVFILVAGTLWIMYNLDYRMMPSMDGNKANAQTEANVQKALKYQGTW